MINNFINCVQIHVLPQIKDQSNLNNEVTWNLNGILIWIIISVLICMFK